MSSHGLFAQDNPFSSGGGEDTGSYGGDRNWRGSRRGGGDRGARRGGGDRRSGQGYRGRGRGRGGRGRGGWQDRGYDQRHDEEDNDGDIRMEEKRWSEKGGLKKTPPGYGRGGVFGRLGRREGGSDEGGRGGGRGRGVFMSRPNWDSGGSGGGGREGGASSRSQWHKVTIPRGGLRDQDQLLQALESAIGAPLQPSNIHVINDRLMFFLDNSRTASQLKRLYKITIDNDTMTIRVFPSPPPRPDRGGEGGTSRDREGDDPMEAPTDSGWRGYSRGRPWERGGRGGTRRGSGTFDGDTQMHQDTTAVLLACLGQRYDVTTKSLDLSSMYHDPGLKENGVRGSMYSREFVASILELVGTNCPELLSLDLSGNRLQHLDAYTTLPTVCSSIQIINLSDNDIRSLSELEKFSGMAGVTTLGLDGNPFTQGGTDVMSMAPMLRKIFPNIQNVDGQNLPSPVKFDLPVCSGQLPPTQKGFVVNDQVQRLVVEFVKQYYSLYDGDRREKLFEAYSEDAVFSLSVTGALTRRDAPMDKYMSLSHNLARMKEPGKRTSLVKHGRIDIVQCLRDLPRTKNHLPSFSVDVMRATSNSTAFVIYGFFSEVGGSKLDNVPVRAFTRTFVLMSIESGIAVTNDQMTLRPASQQQRKIAYEELASLQQQSQPPLQPVIENPQQQHSQQSLLASQQQQQQQQTGSIPSVSGFTTQVAAPPTVFPLTNAPSYPSVQDQAVMRIAQTTNMNLEWSKKCLLENEWDFNKAVTAFTLLNSQGKIPQDAFQ